ncbi:unnamed protein product [Schistocephalus solidus]|uniref:Uncharacterized protein n=1 Tax=Schistocephalus solidus TaxID=70667 RepID=A0A183TH87_SCHSO|nr:unnamed protein product [Schistocephalus solidus]
MDNGTTSEIFVVTKGVLTASLFMFFAMLMAFYLDERPEISIIYSIDDQLLNTGLMQPATRELSAGTTSILPVTAPMANTVPKTTTTTPTSPSLTSGENALDEPPTIIITTTTTAAPTASNAERSLNRTSVICDADIHRLPKVDLINDLDIPLSLPETIRSEEKISIGKHQHSTQSRRSSISLRMMAEYSTIFQIWCQEQVSLDFKDMRIVDLYKWKRNRQLCDNHRGISLFNIAGKIFTRVLFICLNGQLEPGRFLETILINFYHDELPGTRITYRTVGHFLNTWRMQAPTRVYEYSLRFALRGHLCPQHRSFILSSFFVWLLCCTCDPSLRLALCAKRRDSEGYQITIALKPEGQIKVCLRGATEFGSESLAVMAPY